MLVLPIYLLGHVHNLITKFYPAHTIPNTPSNPSSTSDEQGTHVANLNQYGTQIENQKVNHADHRATNPATIYANHDQPITYIVNQNEENPRGSFKS